MRGRSASAMPLMASSMLRWVRTGQWEMNNSMCPSQRCQAQSPTIARSQLSRPTVVRKQRMMRVQRRNQLAFGVVGE